MKLLKNSFALAIALVAIGLTLASYAGAFEKAAPVKNDAQIPDCFTVITTCNPSATYTINVSDCPIDIIENRGLIGASTPVDPDEVCPPLAPIVFCCAKIIPGGNCPPFTPAGLPLGQYMVDEVICKTRTN